MSREINFVDLHRHDEFSIFDGFGSPKTAAKLAKEQGKPALGVTNHGTVSGLVEHYTACKNEGIKPILGVEAYFQPKFDKEKRKYHMTLLVKNMTGYQNMMRMMSEANEFNFYRNATVDLNLLKKYSNGLIMLSGCVVGYTAKLVLGDKDKEGNVKSEPAPDKAISVFKKFKEIFEDDFYMEVMPPYGYQPQIPYNNFVIEQSKKLKLPVVLTTDAHYAKEEDYDTYQLMHELAGRKQTDLADYSCRYIMTPARIQKFWKRDMVDYPKCLAYMDNTIKIAEQCNVDLTYSNTIPKIDWGVPSKEKLFDIAKNNLVKAGLWGKPNYRKRIKYEFEVIFEKGFEDYFLLCYDIIRYATENNIGIGYGRGSVCGSLLAYAIGLTQVDPLIMDTDFERFLRPDKSTIPDVDLDFDAERRDEIIKYLLEKHPGKSAQISNFGTFRAKNVCNDMAKHFKIIPEIPKEISKKEKAILRDEIAVKREELDNAKRKLEHLCKDGDGNDLEYLCKSKDLEEFNVENKDFVKHFSKLYNQIKCVGRHAAGVAITNDEMYKYFSVMRVGGAAGKMQCCYDMNSIDKINVIKMDVLALSTITMVKDIEKLVGTKFSYDILYDDSLYEDFSAGKTTGIFQFDSDGAINVLKQVKPDNIEELVACNALNRPGPLSRPSKDEPSTLDMYILGKQGKVDKTSIKYKVAPETYGTFIYQEQIMRLCRNIAGFSWSDSDKIMKAISKKNEEEAAKYRDEFIEKAITHGKLKRKQAQELYGKGTLYLFNKSHAVGYTLMAVYAMWLKKKYPLEFWWALMKNEKDEIKRVKYASCAVRAGILLFPPHINNGANFSIGKYKGDRVIREGLLNIKGIGVKSALGIEALGPFKSSSEFVAKVNSRVCNKKIMELLVECGALEFDPRAIEKRLEDYNVSLYGRTIKYS